MWHSTAGRIIILTFCLLLIPFAADAQPGVNVRRIGILTSGPAPSEDAIRQSPFWQAMHKLGWRVGQNITVERRDADGHVERLPEFAADLVCLRVDLIIASGTQATQAAMHATTTIPIVMNFTAFAVESGLVTSLARPGGNVTGITFDDPELVAKRMELLKEAVPNLTHLGVIFDQENPTGKVMRPALQAAARALGITLHLLNVLGSGMFEQLLATVPQEPLNALWVSPNVFASRYRQEIADFAVKKGLPMLGPKSLVELGGLMSYEETERDRASRVASYVDRILKGAQPADLPIERPLRFQLVLNLKTAKALGLTIPPTLLFQADEVIQ
jgi:putative ABC transport system substrate-binding protein